MLTEQRYEQILKLLEKEGSITVTEVNYSSCIGKAAYSRICGWVDWTGRVHISGCRNDNRIYAGVLL